jgi:fumarate reductase flavoprotein subunit
MNSLPFETDVIVVGGGLAGHCAALAAVEAGADVILLEKQRETGGSTVLSGGFFAFAGTPEQSRAGVDDDAALLLTDLRNIGGGAADEDLIVAYAHGQHQLREWLTSHGVNFGDLELSAGQSVARSQRTDPTKLLASLAKAITQSGRGQILHGSAADRLLRDDHSSPVNAVEIRQDSGTARIMAKRAVVLATGGFTRSEKLLANFAPNQAKALRIGGTGNTGDGLIMAWELGAAFRDMGQIKGTFGTHPETGPDKHEVLLAFYMGAIIVNQAGQRFIDESMPYKAIGEAGLKQPGGRGYQIWDEGIMATSQPGVPLFDFEPALARGLLIKADSIEGLAARCGIDPSALAATVASYNDGVMAGRDTKFGRDGLCNHAGQLRPIIDAPFYAYPSTTVVLSTYCGLHITADGAVRNVRGDLIPGLYAAGEVIGGFHGESYMTGSALGKAAYFGYRAGLSAARGH